MMESTPPPGILTSDSTHLPPPSFRPLPPTPACREVVGLGSGGLWVLFFCLLLAAPFFPIPGPREVGQSQFPSLAVGMRRDEEALLFIGCWLLGWPGRGQGWHVGAAPASLAWDSVWGVRGVSGALHTAHSVLMELSGSAPPGPGRSLQNGSGWGWCSLARGHLLLQPCQAPEAAGVSFLSSHRWVL